MREMVEDEGSRGTGIEALVIIRGGGSLESLQAFNNEALVREVIDFPVPVIAGIGHDQDVPLMALAADYMTSTPTAAAHLLEPVMGGGIRKSARIRRITQPVSVGTAARGERAYEYVGRARQSV